jgi:NADH-quinone oxidoreductase subunit N
MFLVIGSFAVITVMARDGDTGNQISDYRGLARRQPLVALAFAVLLLGQAGAPFTTGFLAKFGVVSAAVDTHGYVLAVVAMVSAAIAAFFYLRLAVTMYSPVGLVGNAADDGGDDEASAVAGPVGGDGAVSNLQVLTDAPPTEAVTERGLVTVPGLTALAIGVSVAFTLVFGIFPGPILDFAHQATLLFT